MPDDDPLHDLRTRRAHDLRAELAEATKDELIKLLLFHDQALLDLGYRLLEAKNFQRGKGAIWDWIAVQQALHAVNRFLDAHDMQDASSPLVMIKSALEDLQHGLTPAMLRPRADGDHEPPHLKQIRGSAAGIMDGLMMKPGGMSRHDAEEWVSKKLSAAGHEVAPRTVRDWRKDARNHKKNPELYEAYRKIIKFPAWKKDDRRAHAERLIAALISVRPQK